MAKALEQNKDALNVNINKKIDKKFVDILFKKFTKKCFEKEFIYPTLMTFLFDIILTNYKVKNIDIKIGYYHTTYDGVKGYYKRIWNIYDKYTYDCIYGITCLTTNNNKIMTHFWSETPKKGYINIDEIFPRKFSIEYEKDLADYKQHKKNYCDHIINSIESDIERRKLIKDTIAYILDV